MRDLETYAAQGMAMLDAIAVPYAHGIKWEVNSRAKTRWGMAQENPDGTWTIQISHRLLKDDMEIDGLINTIIHELLHTVPGGGSHTGVWLEYATLVNRTYHMNVKRGSTSEEKGVEPEPIQTYKYILRCQKCGCLIGRSRTCNFVRNPSNFFHVEGGCHGRFERIK